MIQSIDLNVDCGEGYDDTQLLAYATTAHISCGLHAGSAQTMKAALLCAKANGVFVGAHPSYPDREGFGRREITIPPKVAAASLQNQIEEIENLANQVGIRISSVKPHGALYHRMCNDVDYALALTHALGSHAKTMVWFLRATAPSISRLEEESFCVIAEGFCDRRYRPDGSLASRDTPTALITTPEECGKQALSIALHQKAPVFLDSEIQVICTSLCVHSDSKDAHLIISHVRSKLEAAGIKVKVPQRASTPQKAS